MSKIQKYGIKYPFTSDNDEGYLLDLNETLADGVKSQVLHVIFTPKGQKLRDPDFGTDLRSAMSYANAKNLQQFIGKVQWDTISYDSRMKFMGKLEK